MKYLASLKRHRKGIYVAGLIGFISIIIHDFSGSPLLDSLLVALTLGIAVRSFVKFSDDFKSDFYAVPGMLIPPGVVLYGAVNLNFSEFQVIDSYFYYIPFVVLMVYLMTILFLSYLFGVKEKESYLIAAGSTICGASAITVTSRSIGAKPDEVARSLISVYLSALIGLCLLIPFVSSYFGLSDVDYSVFIGTVFQFTGFVKVAARDSPMELQQLALAVKATRYVGLFFLIPTFSSLVKGRIHVPWFLWGFLGAGLLFTHFSFLHTALDSILKAMLALMWCVAMAAIGLNANLKSIFTREGKNIFLVSVISFFVAVIVFLGGLYFWT